MSDIVLIMAWMTKDGANKFVRQGELTGTVDAASPPTPQEMERAMRAAKLEFAKIRQEKAAPRK